MGLFVTTITQLANAHGVFAIERSSPPAITGQGTGTAGIVGQFPWGDDTKIIEPTDTKDRILKIAPPGMDHTGSGYMCVQGKPWPDLRLVRALGSTAVAATALLTSAGPVTNATVTMKCKGTAGNSITCTVKAASDLDANHFDLDVTVTGPSGSTTDVFQNINFSGVGTASVVDCSRAVLVASIAAGTAGRPTNATYTASGGTNGTIDATAYLGTPDTADRGLALFEGAPDVDVVFSDDPGNSLRVAVNAGLQAHQLLTGNRVAVLNGNQGLTPAAVRVAAAVNSSTGVAWVDSWFYQRDDVDRTERLVSPSCALALLMCCLSPSLSPAWKGQLPQDLLSFITRTEFLRSDSAAKGNAAAGVCTIIKEAVGGHTFYAAVNTYAPVDATKKNLTRTRMGIYIAGSVTNSLRPNVDAPNVPSVRGDVLGAIANFNDGLKQNMSENPFGLPYIVDWKFADLESANSQADIAAGDFTIPVDYQLGSAMERIIFSVKYGENVVITVA